MIQVLMDESKFALMGDDSAPGNAVDYGEIATAELAGRRYIAICDDADGDPEVFELTARPRSLRTVPFSTEEVELEIEDDDDEEEEEDGEAEGE